LGWRGGFRGGTGLGYKVREHLHPPGSFRQRGGFPLVNPFNGTLAQGAVAFELRFAEPLITCGFVRELLALPCRFEGG